MKALKLSNVVRAAVPIVDSRPPFGASGFTHSKCLKSGGYLSSPKADRPCLPLSAAALAEARRRPASSASLEMCMSLALASSRISQVSGPSGLAPSLGQPPGRRLIVPPHPHERAVARGQLVRTAVHVPHGQALERQVILWNDIVVP